MMKPLDQQLSDLAVRAKRAEDAIAAARKDTREAIRAHREEFRTQAAAAADRVNADLKSAGDALASDWSALKSKVAEDVTRLKAAVADAQVERNVTRLADRADRRETEAGIAIDFAVAAIENAKLAVLDAVIAEDAAAQARQNA